MFGMSGDNTGAHGFRVDKKTVNVISTGIFNDDLKVMQMVLNFFLTRDGRFDDKKKEADEEPVARRTSAPN